MPDTILVSGGRDMNERGSVLHRASHSFHSPTLALRNTKWMTAWVVKGVLLSELLKCGERRVHFGMEEIHCCCWVFVIVVIALGCLPHITWQAELLTNLDCGSSGFLRFRFSPLGT